MVQLHRAHTVEVENDNGVETITESGEDGNGVLVGGVVEGSAERADAVGRGDRDGHALFGC